LGSRISGSLAFDFNQLLLNQNVYSGPITGSVTSLETEVIDVNLDGGGAFVGPNAEGFLGASLDVIDDPEPGDDFIEVIFVFEGVN
jgi:hypothetical protein